jgi:hypothetical protein
MAISRMQQPRQLYGLGSLVKSIGKTVKKVVKSPIGKAAMLYFAPMAFGQSAGLAGYKGLLGGLTSAFTGGSALPPSMGLGKTKGILSALTGKIPGGGYTVGAIGSILAASGMGPEEIEATKRNPEKLKIYLRDYYSKTNPDASDEEVDTFVETNVSEYAVGGRVGLESGTPKKGLESISIKDMDKFLIKGPYKIRYDEDGNPIRPEFPRKGEPHKYNPDKKIDRKNMPFILPLKRNKSAFGGLQSMPMGQMRRNQAGTIERDYRETGGFVPVGIKEKADDVPAMLSKNEFVMTADAVKGMGDGNIEKGAQRLYDQMKQAEKRVV